MEIEILPEDDPRDVHVVPIGQGVPKHEDSNRCWCQPGLDSDFTDHGGSKVWLHREIQ